jgi:tRNA (guanine-N7-)-methyltransferase
MSRHRVLPVPLAEVPFVLALEKLSPPLSWADLFGREGPVEIEIGSGKGLFLLEASRLRPDSSFLGVERAGKWFHRAVERVLRSGRSNIRLVRTDAFDFLARWVPPHSVDALHVYFPDPWPKKRHAKRRLWQGPLFELAARVLKPGAPLLLASDVAPYLAEAAADIASLGSFAAVDWPEDSPDRLPTNYARKYLLEGRTLHFAKFLLNGAPGEPRGPAGSRPSGSC